MLHRLMLKVSKFQLPPPKRLSTVVKNILGGHHAPPCQIGLTLFRPGFFYRLKVQEGVFRDPLMISGTIKASPMKLCTVIVLLKTYQNTKRNFQKMTYDVTMTSLLKTMAKFGPPRNQTKYISFER